MRFLVGLLLCLMPVQTLALSCMPWHLEDAYQQADESADAYVIVRGVLTFDETALPRVNWDRQQDVPPQSRIPARLSGHSLSRAGFKAPFDASLTFVVQCYGPWCSSAQSGVTALVFLKRVSGGYELETNPCGGMLFQNPSKQDLRKVRSCIRGDSCTPE